MRQMKIITITREQVCDETTCPVCKSKDIIDTSCRCLCQSGCSCWSYPKCGGCGFTAGAAAGNSQGGIWISFSKLNSSKTYEVKYHEKTTTA